jgi:hypothetical protein
MPEATRRSRRSTRGGGKRSLSTLGDKGRSNASKPSEEELLELVPGGLATAFVNAKLHDKAIALAGLTPPTDWEGEMPVIPDNIASLDHDAMSNLMGRFVNALSTATWQASTAYVEHGFYKQISDYLENVAILDAEQSNEQKRRAEAATSESVVAARALEQTAYAAFKRFESMASQLKAKHATVSRVGGFVGDETEAEDQGPAPHRSLRGKSTGSARGEQRTVRRNRRRK